MPWTVRLTPEAEQQLAKLTRGRQEILKRAIERMKEDPFLGNVKPLKGKQWKGVYRRVVGRYRLLFVPGHRRTVEIVSIRLRTEKTYR